MKINLKNHKISIIKAITWRILGTLTTIIISFIISGNIKIGLSIGFFELIGKTLLYYFHEIVWNKIKKNE